MENKYRNNFARTQNLATSYTKRLARSGSSTSRRVESTNGTRDLSERPTIQIRYRRKVGHPTDVRVAKDFGPPNVQFVLEAASALTVLIAHRARDRRCGVRHFTEPASYSNCVCRNRIRPWQMATSLTIERFLDGFTGVVVSETSCSAILTSPSINPVHGVYYRPEHP